MLHGHAAVWEECRSICHWETGKVNLHNDTLVRMPACFEILMRYEG